MAYVAVKNCRKLIDARKDFYVRDIVRGFVYTRDYEPVGYMVVNGHSVAFFYDDASELWFENKNDYLYPADAKRHRLLRPTAGTTLVPYDSITVVIHYGYQALVAQRVSGISPINFFVDQQLNP